MLKLKDFIGRIRNYLGNRESEEDRRELFQWYDSIHESDAWTEDEYVQIGQQAKQRILQTIGVKGRKSQTKLSTWLRVAAAAILLLLGGLYWFMLPSDRAASQAELISLSPDQNHAVIILPSGETVGLDSIGLAQSIQVGNTIISKSATGEISYECADQEENPIYTLQTPKATVSEIVLSDGTKVMLNAESKLHYPAKFTGDERVVRLEGEGYFQVTKQSQKSRFIVETKDQRTIVLGTKFNLRSYPYEQEIWTTLEEGAVQVAGPQKQNALLKAGQQAIHGTTGLKVRKVEVESILSWTKGIFYFDGTNTSEVLRQIEQWYDIDINYKQNKANAQYIGKIPRNLPLNKLVDLLTYAEFKVEPRINKENRINLIIN